MEYNLGTILLFYVIELMKLGLVMWGILEFPLRREKRYYSFLMVPVVLIAVLVFGNFPYRVQLVDSIMPILIIIVVCVILEGKVRKKLSNAVLMHLCIIFFDVCVAGIMTLVFNMTLTEMAENTALHIFSDSFNILTFSIIILIKKWRKKTFNIQFTKRTYALIFAGVSTGMFFIAGLIITNLPGATDNARKLVLIFIIIFSTANLAGILMLIFITKSRDNYKVLSQINEAVIESQQNYYTLAQEKQQEIRSIRHEMKNHIACIDALYKNNQLKEMHDYINQVIGDTDNLDDLFDTGNGIVNAILNDAQSKHKKNGITIRLNGTFPKEINISSMDLCVIFANAISNAVEAIQKIGKDKGGDHLINVSISSFKEDLFIDISNPIDRKVVITEGKLRTTKQEKSLHGFGTANMRQRVEKYNGSISFESDESMFYVHIEMKNGK